MASIIEGYNYDIFISYRQKDNKGDRWVSEFVDALKDELESTFKEDISIYFDENPHDRLQDTHNVDKSLEGKLKCIIFIPIISQTYCDPRSYAWQKEFLAFNRLAENDQYGKDVKLRGGNVASRILPIRIYDLDEEDAKLFEKETGSVLRALDFVFKTSSGVNRPLTPSDNPDRNLNKTFYRDQINKVANTIKEIVSGLKTEPVAPVKREIQQKEPSEQISVEEKSVRQGKPLRKISKRMLLSGIATIAILIIAGILAYPKIFKRDALERLRSSNEKISIAILPFLNRTNNASTNDYQGIVQDILINSLSNNEKIKIKQYELITYLLQGKNLPNNTSFSTSIASKISKKLDANVFIYGSINQASDRIHLSSQLIDTRTGVVIKPFLIDASSKEHNIINIAESLSVEISNFLSLSYLQRTAIPEEKKSVSTQSPEAYSLYISGTNAFYKSDYRIATEMLLKSIEIDSSFYFPYRLIAYAYGNQNLYGQAKKWALDAYNKRDRLPLLQKLMADEAYARFFGTPNESFAPLKQIEEIDDKMPRNYYLKGNRYRDLDLYDKAIPEYVKALEIYKEWGVRPAWGYNYTNLGRAYHETGMNKKEKKLYKEAEKDFPDEPSLLQRQAILALSEGRNKAANNYIEKYTSISRGNSETEASITANLAGIYSEAGILDKAEEYYREALLLEPENSGRMNAIAYFLIDIDRDIKEGLELVDEALELGPDNFDFLDTKGWGLYKQGQYQEAKDILQKSWDLRMKNAIYNHAAYLHLEEAKKAVASQKSN